MYDLSIPTVAAYSWDLTDQPGFFGTVLADAAGRYVATELVEKNPDGTVRHNAGLHLVDLGELALSCSLSSVIQSGSLSAQISISSFLAQILRLEESPGR